MSTFKQKNVIKSYKLRLQEKLKNISEETDNATSFLNNCVDEFRKRVQHILEIKDEKCLSLYRQLNRDLENFSEKLYILQTTFGEVSEDESDSSEDEGASTSLSQTQPKTLSSSQDESFSQVQVSSCEKSVNRQKQENVDLQKYAESLTLQIYSKETVTPYRCTEKNISQQRSTGENIAHQICPERHLNDVCQDEDGENTTEDDFYSLNSDNVQNTNSCASFSSQLHGSHNAPVSLNDCTSNISFSQNSYYSLSSVISEPENKNNQTIQAYPVKAQNESSLESLETNIQILPSNFEVNSHFSGTLSYVVDPGDFWIQLENSQGYKISFPKSENGHLPPLSVTKRGSYCLAPLNSAFYYRAQSLSDGKSGKELITVQFIDLGSIKEIPLCNLRPLPRTACKITAQAIHCYLHGIKPIGDSWSPESIERLKDFQQFCIETLVLSKESSYGVQLETKLSAEIDEDFSVDIGQALCLDGFAISLHEPLLEHQHYESQLSKPICDREDDSSVNISGSYDINAISNDSGVSVASALSYQISNKRNEIFHKVSEDYTLPVAVKCDVDSLDLKQDMQMKDLILFESCDALVNLQSSNEALKSTVASSSYCLACRDKNFCLHLKVPSPSLLFVEKDMVIVMLSYIINPHEFYVNMAMEDIGTLDDLREQMTYMYESERNFHQVKINDLIEDMFCAGRFNEDGYWYRIKIIRFNQEDKEKNQALGQYIDYGNTSVIRCCDLRLLNLEYSQHPSFAIKCTLAGVNPIKGANSSNNSWEEEAIDAFKKLTSYERCLTAQICKESFSNQNDCYPVLLWDTEDSKDLLINAALADQKVAVFDSSLVVVTDQKAPHESQINLDLWDPLLEEYNDCQNTYALDDENIEVMTTGYQARDEEYTCKYFALRGHCPRGSNCRFEHLPLLESGVTRDQEEVYCLDTVPIISETVNNMLVQVSAIITPTHFYVVLPFGCKTVDDIDNLVYKGSSYDEIINSEAKALFYGIDKHYSNTPFSENTTIALSCGTIVAAKRKWDEKWHRGRIVDVTDINKPAKVFFVDSGDHEWVPRKHIRTILPQFLHTPFQAVHCMLYGIEPVRFEKELSWSPEAINYFKDIVAGEILLAEIIHRFGQVLHVSLRKTSQNDHANVAQLLMSAGFAQHHRVVHSNKKQTKYVPG